MKNPPILVSVLGFFVVMAGFAWLFFGLRLLWLLVGFGLGTLQRWAWMAAAIVAGLAVFEAFLWMVQYPGSGLGIAMMIMPGIILIYLNSAEVKDAFGVSSKA